jgi:hypothetical protein
LKLDGGKLERKEARLHNRYHFTSSLEGKNAATEVHDFEHLLPDLQSVIEPAAGSQSNLTQLSSSSSHTNDDDVVDLSSDDEEVELFLEQDLEVVQKWSVLSFNRQITF